MKGMCVARDARPHPGQNFFITARIRRMGKVIFSVCLSVHTRGNPSPRFFPRSLVLGPFGEVPQSWLGGGYPSIGYPPGRPGWSIPLARTVLGYPPGQVRMGYPPARTGVPPQDRIAEQALTMQRAVCLLHSHKRTFLFSCSFWKKLVK